MLSPLHPRHDWTVLCWVRQGTPDGLPTYSSNHCPLPIVINSFFDQILRLDTGQENISQKFPNFEILRVAVVEGGEGEGGFSMKNSSKLSLL